MTDPGSRCSSPHGNEPPMAFWYPNALDGQRQVPDVTYINLRDFRDQIEQAATLLEAIDCELGALNDIKSDWLRSLAVA